MKTHPIVALVGPTASGKTALSLLLAEILDGEIVSADSRQVYKYMDIGTAKPTLADRQRIPHHFIDILEPSEGFSAGQYGLEARKTIGQILKRKKIPILVGGSGLYLKAAIDGLSGSPAKDPEIRRMLEERFQREGIQELLDTLKDVDPVALGKMKEITPRRVLRALEVFYITGKAISEFHALQNQTADFETSCFGLQWDRRELYERISQRVDWMITTGLIDEARTLLARGYDRRLNALNTVGYKEVFDFLDGRLSRESTVELIKRNSRRFAKRQLTWFRADSRIQWLLMSKNLELTSIARRIVALYHRNEQSA